MISTISVNIRMEWKAEPGGATCYGCDDERWCEMFRCCYRVNGGELKETDIVLCPDCRGEVVGDD